MSNQEATIGEAAWHLEAECGGAAKRYVYNTFAHARASNLTYSMVWRDDERQTLQIAWFGAILRIECYAHNRLA